MANQTNRSDDDYKEILEYLRQKVRQYGFIDADVSLEAFIEEPQLNVEETNLPSRDALRKYVKGLFEYLDVFSEGSLEHTEMLFAEVFGPDIEVPFYMSFERESIWRADEKINLKDYQQCSILTLELDEIMRRIDPDWNPSNSQRNRPRF